jgi:hypothetical protein
LVDSRTVATQWCLPDDSGYRGGGEHGAGLDGHEYLEIAVLKDHKAELLEMGSTMAIV